MRFPPLDFAKVRTFPVADRSNKVAIESFARPHVAGSGLDAFLKSLPSFLAVEDLRAVAAAIATAVRAGRPVVLMIINSNNW